MIVSPGPAGEAGLEPRYLGLELTESVLVNHQKEGTDALHSLRAMGLHLAVDDFGTGYSSFSYLKHFPLDTLKIDRSFIREIATHPDDAAITTAIIAMGHALGLKVIAEGVETRGPSDAAAEPGLRRGSGLPHRTPCSSRSISWSTSHGSAAPMERRRVASDRHPADRSKSWSSWSHPTIEYGIPNGSAMLK